MSLQARDGRCLASGVCRLPGQEVRRTQPLAYAGPCKRVVSWLGVARLLGADRMCMCAKPCSGIGPWRCGREPAWASRARIARAPWPVPVAHLAPRWCAPARARRGHVSNSKRRRGYMCTGSYIFTKSQYFTTVPLCAIRGLSLPYSKSSRELDHLKVKRIRSRVRDLHLRTTPRVRALVFWFFSIFAFRVVRRRPTVRSSSHKGLSCVSKGETGEKVRSSATVPCAPGTSHGPWTMRSSLVPGLSVRLSTERI